jgi:cytochrome P450
MILASLCLTLLLALCFVKIVSIFTKVSAKYALPPGPGLLRMMKCIPQITSAGFVGILREWHEELGDIICFKVGSLVLISIGSQDAVIDLLIKRGNLYNGRPRLNYLGEYVTKGRLPLLMDYDNLWKSQHRLHVSVLSKNATDSYQILQEVETKQLLHGLLSASDFNDEFSRFTASISYTLGYGKRILDINQEEHNEISLLTHFLRDSVSLGNSLVEIFPILDYLPECLAPWKRQGNRAYDTIIESCTANMKAALERGCWNWAYEILQADQPEISWDQKCFTILEIFVTISNTTNMAMETFVLATLLYPEAAQKARMEIDSVIGDDSLPSFEHISRLPYLNAFLLELHRWRPVTPTMLPHSAREDDYYMGHYFKKDAIVLPNTWAINMNSKTFASPDTFLPERWLDNPDLPELAFGCGRRTCPGQNVARSTLFLTISRILWGFDITTIHPVDADISKFRVFGVAFRPAPLCAVFTVRSTKRRDVIEMEWEASEKDDKKILTAISKSFKPPI